MKTKRTVPVGLVVKPNGKYYDILLNYDNIRKAVGGYIEGVGLDDELFVYVHEEGKLEGLQTNRAATVFCQTKGLPINDFIVGPAVFCGPADDEGYDTSICQKHRDQIMAILGAYN